MNVFNTRVLQTNLIKEVIIALVNKHSNKQVWELPFDGDMSINGKVPKYYGIDLSIEVCKDRNS